MPRVEDIHTDEVINLEQMITYLDSLGEDPLGKKTEEVMLQLRKLCNNKRFLVDKLTEQMHDLEHFESINPYSSQVFLLHIGEHYSIRVVVWEPESGRVGEEVFFYDDLHDHNFELLTIGYTGTGYNTVLYEYNYDDITGAPNESVVLKNKTNVQLEENRILLMSGSCDVHSQFPPKDFSVSLNIMQINAKDLDIQYEFGEPDSETGLSKVSNRTVYFDVESISECLASLNCKESAPILRDQIAREKNPKKRMALFNALAHLQKDEAWQLAARDTDKKIAGKAKGMLAQ